LERELRGSQIKAFGRRFWTMFSRTDRPWGGGGGGGGGGGVGFLTGKGGNEANKIDKTLVIRKKTGNGRESWKDFTK